MKWTKRIMMVLVLCFMMLGIDYGIGMVAEASNVQIAVPDEVQLYVEKNKDEIFTTVIEAWEIQDADIEDLEYGAFFVVYDGEENPDAVYYVPVEYQEEVIVVVAVLDTDQGLLYQCSEEYVPFLNGINYLNNPAIFYEKNGELYAETREDKMYCSSDIAIGISEEQKDRKDDFIGLSYNDKCEEINDWISNMEIIESVTVTDENSDLSMTFQKTLTLYYPMGQYGYGMCWAAASATVINYLNGTGVYPFYLCNIMGIGYDDGGTVYDEQNALAKYGISYDYIRSSINNFSMTVVSNNIDAGYPLILNVITADGSSGHAVTIYGYTSTNYIYYWDPNLNDGSGGKTSASYSSLGSSFLMINKSYYGWHSSLSKK